MTYSDKEAAAFSGSRSPGGLWQEVCSRHVGDGELVVWWLYQSGLILKSRDGTVLLIDPYLSNASLRSYNVARKVAPPLDANQVKADAVLASHSHPDHLDPDSVTAFASHSSTRFVGPPMAISKVVFAGVELIRTSALQRGDTVSIGDVTVRAVYARHPTPPEPVPDAIGFVLESHGVRLYHSGDTEYDSEILRDTMDVSVSFVAINGTAGNMNAHEAALLAWQQRARVAIPFHYGLWKDEDYGPGATLDPFSFQETYRRLKPDGRSLVLQPLKAVAFNSRGVVD